MVSDQWSVVRVTSRPDDVKDMISTGAAFQLYSAIFAVRFIPYVIPLPQVSRLAISSIMLCFFFNRFVPWSMGRRDLYVKAEVSANGKWRVNVNEFQSTLLFNFFTHRDIGQ